MKEINYIIIRAEENNVKIITKKNNNEENLDIINIGEVLIININDNIINFKIVGKARIISKLDPIISE